MVKLLACVAVAVLLMFCVDAYAVIPSPSPSPEPGPLFGDVSKNGVITAFDAALVLQHVVGIIQLTGEELTSADVSGDGTVSAFDATLILQFVVEIRSRFPVEGGPVPKLVGSQERTITVGRSEYITQNMLSLPILIDEMSGVLAGYMELLFKGQMDNIQVSTANMTEEYLIVSNVSDNVIQIAFAGTVAPEGKGEVLRIQFRAQDLFDLGLEVLEAQLNEGMYRLSIVEQEDISPPPQEYSLAQSYPNPFNPYTTIRYEIREAGRARLDVFNTLGQKIRTLVNENQKAGRYSVVWDSKDDQGKDMASGLYLYRIEAGDFVKTRKMILIR